MISDQSEYVKQGLRETGPLALFHFLDLKTIQESGVPDFPFFSPVHRSDISAVRLRVLPQIESSTGRGSKVHCCAISSHFV